MLDLTKFELLTTPSKDQIALSVIGSGKYPCVSG